MSKYKMPELPDNQRWVVESSFNTFLIVKLQENRYRKNPWWGWRTIDSSTGSLVGGEYAVEQCVYHIQNREYFDKIRRERDDERQERINRIPFGVSK